MHAGLRSSDERKQDLVNRKQPCATASFHHSQADVQGASVVQGKSLWSQIKASPTDEGEGADVSGGGV